tara:strand:- start:236 stop:994 length:759 start_codon:yes stop_codon:yes gene_type:complete
MKHIKTALAVMAGAVFLFISSPLLAQAPVEDRTVRTVNSGGSAPQPDPNVQLIVELQNLRQEISYLRGTVEELQYQIDELEDQQGQNYTDLDNRVRALYSGDVSPSSGTTSAPTAASPSTSGTASSTESNSQATALYQQGFDALRLGDRDQAIEAFDQLVENYPQSSEVPDALYWLGETYWLANRREDSRQAFVQLLDAHPNYRKSSDAKYRLGVIYEQMGDLGSARTYMQEAAQGNTGQAAAAKSWLDQHN